MTVIDYSLIVASLTAIWQKMFVKKHCNFSLKKICAFSADHSVIRAVMLQSQSNQAPWNGSQSDIVAKPTTSCEPRWPKKTFAH